MVRTVTCRLYPTRAQAVALSTRLDAACELYNATLRKLHSAWAENEGPAACVDAAHCGDAISPTADDVVHRAEQAFRAFVLKRQNPNPAGVPPLPTRQHVVSVTFVDWSACTRGGLELPGVGAVAVNQRRALPAPSVPVTVKRRGPIWQACFSVKA